MISSRDSWLFALFSSSKEFAIRRLTVPWECENLVILLSLSLSLSLLTIDIIESTATFQQHTISDYQPSELPQESW